MNPYLLEIKSEFLSLLRMPRYSVTAIAFPVMFYVFFGLMMQAGHPGGDKAATYFLGTFGAIGVMNAALWGLGAGIAAERGLGWLQLKRASPMPPLAYYMAKITSAMAFSLIIITLLFALGAIFGGARMEPRQWALLVGTLLAGSIPFCALGFILGYIAGPNSAPATVNLVALPMAFCSGLWIPIEYLPQAVQKIAPVLPAYHLAQISLAVIGAPSRGAISFHIEILAAITLVFAGIAWIVWRRDEEKTYG
jgi:ABC-2 type transport system permease protein